MVHLNVECSPTNLPDLAILAASVKYGSEISGAGDNRTIPEDEGGDIQRSGQPTKARDFEGVGVLEGKAELDRRDRGGDEDVDSMVRQGQSVRDGTTRNS